MFLSRWHQCDTPPIHCSQPFRAGFRTRVYHHGAGCLQAGRRRRSTLWGKTWIVSQWPWIATGTGSPSQRDPRCEHGTGSLHKRNTQHIVSESRWRGRGGERRESRREEVWEGRDWVYKNLQYVSAGRMKILSVHTEWIYCQCMQNDDKIKVESREKEVCVGGRRVGESGGEIYTGQWIRVNQLYNFYYGLKSSQGKKCNVCCDWITIFDLDYHYRKCYFGLQWW